MSESKPFVENLGSSLVREYLHRRGLYSTLKEMDKEAPRTLDSINSRSQLIKELKLEPMVEVNNKRLQPFVTFIDLIIYHILLKNTCDLVEKTKVEPSKLSHLPTASRSPIKLKELKLIHSKLVKQGSNIDLLKLIKISCGCLYNHSPYHIHDACLQEPNNNLEERRQVLDRDERGQITNELQDNFPYSQRDYRNYKETVINSLSAKEGTLLSSLTEKRSVAQLPTDKISQESVDPKVEEKYEDAAISETKEKENVNDPTCSCSQKEVEIVEDHIEDNQAEEEVEDHNINNEEEEGIEGEKSTKSDQGKISINHFLFTCGFLPLSSDMSSKLEILLSGNEELIVPWLGQSFELSTMEDQCYGLKLAEEGCNGVIAVVQAFVIKCLILDLNLTNKKENSKPLRPSNDQVRKALIQALTDILWRTDQSTAVLALADVTHDTNLHKIIQSLTCKTFTSKKDLQEGITKHIDYYSLENHGGCILFILSNILSKGINSALAEMNGRSSLINYQGSCSSELMKYILPGYSGAESFSFEPTHRDRSRAEVGFLTLNEHFKTCQIAPNLKTPRNPVWIVNNGVHYTIIYSCDKELTSNWKAERQFNLFHYDVISGHETMLVIDTTGLHETNTYHGNNVPPLDHCIRTKWKDAVIKWNDPLSRN